MSKMEGHNAVFSYKCWVSSSTGFKELPINTFQLNVYLRLYKMSRHRHNRPYHLSNRICQAGSTAGKGEVKSKYLTRSKRLSAPLRGAVALPAARLRQMVRCNRMFGPHASV